MNRKKRCWFHDWQDSRRVGVLSMLETCSKCGERRVFDGCTGDYIYFPPIKKGLAMSDEYTPTMDHIRSAYADRAFTGPGQDVLLAQFDRAIAAHDKALREQIVLGIMSLPTVRVTSWTINGRAVSHDSAIRIARGEGSE